MAKKEKKQSKPINPRLGVVGGQAVLEGVMMRHQDICAVALRKADGSLTVDVRHYSSLRDRCPILRIPVLRGIINFIESMIVSYKTLDISARVMGMEEEEPEEGKLERWLRKHFGKSVMDVVMTIVMTLGTVLGLALGIGLFLWLPMILTKGFDHWSGDQLGGLRNILEGLIKFLIFLGYLIAVSRMKEIRRTFQYHGAEHKTIFCYEAGEELTPANAQKFKRFHPRCGTSFLFLFLLVNILISSLPFVTWDHMLLRFLTKMLLILPEMGLAYEFLRYAGRHDNLLVRIISTPGLWMQRLTTREPDEAQLETAILALKRALPEEFPEKEPESEPKPAESETEADAAKASETQDEISNPDRTSAAIPESAPAAESSPTISRPETQS